MTEPPFWVGAQSGGPSDRPTGPTDRPAGRPTEPTGRPDEPTRALGGTVRPTSVLGEPRKPAGRRRRPGLIVALVAAVVLVAGVVADRVVAGVVQNRIAARLACPSAHDPVQVRVSGFPVLPGVLGGTLGGVEVTSSTLTGRTLSVRDVHVTASDVRFGHQPDGRVHVGSVDAAFVVPFDRLPAEVAGYPVRYAARADGLLAMSTTVKLGGFRLPVTVTARPALRGDTVTITPTDVEALGMRTSTDLLSAVADVAPGQALPVLPSGLIYRSVSVEQDGLGFRITGADVLLARSTTGSLGCPA